MNPEPTNSLYKDLKRKLWVCIVLGWEVTRLCEDLGWLSRWARERRVWTTQSPFTQLRLKNWSHFAEGEKAVLRLLQMTPTYKYAPLDEKLFGDGVLAMVCGLVWGRGIAIVIVTA
ncbi:hypothetical protein JAAARDRAFT_77694 [Jaapia argillacea MUCL 33604]|uniref:Uncharacterized protein n=1 Tax=Jaapia argillacea MUCL 33604 TaxID=933084 RepID=A0A067Q0H1_9AGAM|nr:hypothetical protein JAAARDRAFT_77694 [Jaapia argillacea MUCL 33604]